MPLRYVLHMTLGHHFAKFEHISCTSASMAFKTAEALFPRICLSSKSLYLQREEYEECLNWSKPSLVQCLLEALKVRAFYLLIIRAIPSKGSFSPFYGVKTIRVKEIDIFKINDYIWATEILTNTPQSC